MNGNEAWGLLAPRLAAVSLGAAAMGKGIWKLLSLSPADDAVWPARYISAVIAEGGLHVLYAQKILGRFRIRGRRFYAAESGMYPAPQAFATDLKLAVMDLNAAGAEIILVVPGSWVITRKADLPAVAGEHLSRVVGYELDRLTPLTADEAYYDFRIIGQEPEAIRLAVAAARVDRLAPYRDAVHERGMTVHRAVSALDALGALCRSVYRAESCLFAAPAADGYEGGLLENGVLSLTFTGKFPSPDRNEQTRILAHEMRDLLHKQAPGTDPLPVVVSGSTGETDRGISEALGRPAKVLGPSQMRGRLGEVAEDLSPAALGGLLAASGPEARGMNLLARGIHPVKKTPWVVTALLVLALLTTGIFYLVSPLRVEERRIAELDRLIALHKDDIRKVEALKREVEIIDAEIVAINRFKEDRPAAMQILKELTTIMPKNSWLSRVRITDSGMDIEGYAAAATEILPRLEASRYFKKAEFTSSTIRDARLNAERFMIRMELEGSKTHGQGMVKKK